MKKDIFKKRLPFFSSSSPFRSNHCLDRPWSIPFGFGKSKTSAEGEEEAEEEEVVVEDATFRVLKRADVKLKVAGKEKDYSVIIKVIQANPFPQRNCTNSNMFSPLFFTPGAPYGRS